VAGMPPKQPVIQIGASQRLLEPGIRRCHDWLRMLAHGPSDRNTGSFAFPVGLFVNVRTAC
jgi:hypothetical protein